MVTNAFVKFNYDRLHTDKALRNFRKSHNNNNSNYTVSQKLCKCYFLNNSIKHWPILIIFGMQHQEET